MIYNFVIYILEVIISNFLFSEIIYLFLLNFNKKREIGNLELFLYSLGLGPAVTALLLYYLFIFFPGRSSLFYFTAIFSVFILLFILGRKNLDIAFKGMAKTKKIFKRFPLIITISFLGVLFIWNLIVVNVPVQDNDMFEYATQGKVFYNTKSIKYKNSIIDSKTNFYYQAKHGLSFPLIATWERVFDNIAGAKKDYYMRSIPGFYWFLIVLVIFLWLSRRNVKLGFLGTAALLLSPGFFWMFRQYGIDSFRIFFLMVTFISLFYMIKNSNNILSLLLFGIFGGIAANIHSIGAILMPIFILALFIFSKDNFSRRLKNVIIVCFLILFFGGVHYILDIFFGTGWIFSL